MPFFDKHWRLRWVGAVVSASFAVFLPIRYLQVAVVWNRLRGLDMTPDLIFAASALVMLAVCAYLLARGAAPARDRLRFRLDVINGVEPPPKARRSTRPVLFRAPRTGRLVVTQRIGPFDHIFSSLFAVMFVASIGFSGLFVLFAVTILTNPGDQSLHSFSSHAFLSLLAATLMLWGIWLFGKLARDLFARSPTYTADDLGVSWHPRYGDSRTMRWQDARLLELTFYLAPEGRTIDHRKRYLLYSLDSVIRIDSEPGFYRQESMLLDAIQRHTGLQPVRLMPPPFQDRIRARIFRHFGVPTDDE
ncbi:MAG TPA: hypothetical protein VFU88_03505 [Ktedonobacterales bacterium]|nr:hypothetical protein [Ktedonobacterales bacterium]